MSETSEAAETLAGGFPAQGRPPAADLTAAEPAAADVAAADPADAGPPDTSVELLGGQPPGGPPAPEPLGVDLGETGNPEVDALVQRLADADELPTEDHVEVYEDVHGGLRDVLAALDQPVGPRPPAPPRNGG